MIECYNRNNDNNIELLNYRIYSGSVSQIKSELYPILRKLSYKNNFIEFVLALKEGNYEINSMIILIYYKLLFDLKTITNKCISNENLIKILDIGLKFNENIIKDIIAGRLNINKTYMKSLENQLNSANSKIKSLELQLNSIENQIKSLKTQFILVVFITLVILNIIF